jgi:L-alanine-DL-glutamate epimerase-like enolase superfamily enzyme
MAAATPPHAPHDAGVARGAHQRERIMSAPALERAQPVATLVQEIDRPSAIERIVTRFVSVPLPQPIKHPFLGARTKFSSLIVEVHTADGLTGFGYASIESVRLISALNEIIRDLESGLKGLDALRHELVWERMYNLTCDVLHDGAANLAITAIDCALWDILGKRTGMPVWKLIGGYRDKVPAYASWTLWRHLSNAELESETAAIRALGFNGMKLRLGGGRSLAEDAVRAKLVRDTAGPDAAIMVDALWGMSATDGVRMARMLGELDYTWFEEPVREGDFTGLRRVRDVQALPIAAGERISRVTGLAELLPVVDHVILDAHHLGGITPWLKAAAAVETANLPISAHSHPLTQVHLLAGKRMGAWLEYMPWWDMLFVDPPRPRDGMLHMTNEPGLGLVVDDAAVARFAVKP